MMEESKLTSFQRRLLTANARGGNSLPLVCNPSSSKIQQHSPTVKNITSPKVMNGKHLNMCGVRKKETIDILVKNDSIGTYRPFPGKLITDKDKRKLQNKMAYGVDIPDIPKKSSTLNEEPEQIEDSDEFDQVLQDIEERRGFLEEMKSLGQGKKYKTLIETEISQKIRELEIIDEKRTKKLEELLLENNMNGKVS